MARLCKKILGIKTAKELSEIVASLGLAQNFAAVYALSTVGIQKGHMSLHAKNIAVMAGANEDQIDMVSNKMIEEENIKLDRAKEILDEIK
jgi:hydroxymethylglutaryl-CoA reductase